MWAYIKVSCIDFKAQFIPCPYLKAQTEDHQELEPNFKLQDILLDEPHDKAANDIELLYTACPAIIRKSKLDRVHRLPDVISIGYDKCGTETLSFLDCHPSIVYRAFEFDFFNNETIIDGIIAAKKNKTRLDQYATLYAAHLPQAAADEILIDKNPNYSKGNSEFIRKISKAIKILIPNVKIIATACDPNLRVVSKMVERFIQ